MGWFGPKPVSTFSFDLSKPWKGLKRIPKPSKNI
jgi:hypothetical protein